MQASGITFLLENASFRAAGGSGRETTRERTRTHGCSRSMPIATASPVPRAGGKIYSDFIAALRAASAAPHLPTRPAGPELVPQSWDVAEFESEQAGEVELDAGDEADGKQTESWPVAPGRQQQHSTVKGGYICLETLPILSQKSLETLPIFSKIALAARPFQPFHHSTRSTRQKSHHQNRRPVVPSPKKVRSIELKLTPPQTGRKAPKPRIAE